jgi:hypothetical protein
MDRSAGGSLPVFMSVPIDPLPASPATTWVEIVGEATFPIEGDRLIPMRHARRITFYP